MLQKIVEGTKDLEFRYITMGWTRVKPYSGTISTPSKLSKLFNEPTAEICLEFGSQLEKKLILSCHCLENEKGDYFKLKLSEINKKEKLTNSILSIEFGSLYIDSIQLYETNNLFSEQQNYDKLNFLSDAIIVKLNNHKIHPTISKYMLFIGEVGEKEHEPTICSVFFRSNELTKIKKKYIDKWKLRETIYVAEKHAP